MNRIGIDVGGVITGSDDTEDTGLLTNNWRTASETEGAVDGITKLVEVFGSENTFIVSKAGWKIRKRTKQWLKIIDFYNRTGMLESNVHFTFTRAEKADVAAELGLTHFIDDKAEVLSYVIATVHNVFLFRPQTFVDDFYTKLVDNKTINLYILANWNLTVRFVKETL